MLPLSSKTVPLFPEPRQLSSVVCLPISPPLRSLSRQQLLVLLDSSERSKPLLVMHAFQLLPLSPSLYLVFLLFLFQYKLVISPELYIISKIQIDVQMKTAKTSYSIVVGNQSKLNASLRKGIASQFGTICMPQGSYHAINNLLLRNRCDAKTLKKRAKEVKLKSC